MKQCPKCGDLSPLGRIYCAKCGAKMKFVEEEIADRAAEERKAEKIAALQDQLVQWIALVIVLVVVAWCFRDYAGRMPEADVPVFFHGPPTIGVGEKIEPMIIGRPKGVEYLKLGTKALPVPRVKVIAPEELTGEQKKQDENAVRSMGGAGAVIVTMKGGKTTLHGKLLGKTLTHVSILKGDKAEVVALDQVESIQEAPAEEP